MIQRVVVLRLEARVPLSLRCVSVLLVFDYSLVEFVVLLHHSNVKLMLVELSKIFVRFLGIILVVFVGELCFVEHETLIGRHGLTVGKYGSVG